MKLRSVIFGFDQPETVKVVKAAEAAQKHLPPGWVIIFCKKPVHIVDCAIPVSPVFNPQQCREEINPNSGMKRQCKRKPQIPGGYCAFQDSYHKGLEIMKRKEGGK